MKKIEEPEPLQPVLKEIAGHAAEVPNAADVPSTAGDTAYTQSN